MRKQLLREWIALEYDPKVLKESKDREGKLVVPAILQKANTKNQNERVYPVDILRREVANYEKVVREQRALGELDHPDSSTVSLDRASHIVREIFWDGETVRGMVEVLDTPKGKILESLLLAGVRIGMSSRGVGSTEKTNEGVDVVQDDYQMICFDAVSEPSTPGAFMNEAKFVEVSGKLFGRPDRINRILNDILVGRKR